ncbi:MAG: hypothetical protein ACFFD4_21770 [Candidatus Odinarchaeota archaeon]
MILDYIIKKRNVNTTAAIKIVSWVDRHQQVAFAVPRGNKLQAKDIRGFYARRFTIETYYRMMHRFLAFSCS